jgi:hypothetical protein
VIKGLRSLLQCSARGYQDAGMPVGHACAVLRFSLGNKWAETYRRIRLRLLGVPTDASRPPVVYPRSHRGAPVIQRSARMPPPCPHCDAPDISLLRLVLISEIIRAEAHVLVSLADLWHQSGLLASTEAPLMQPSPGRLHALRPPIG